MSTSRLEKFVYAICSMEVSDLPAPLSRIEILWNCLITGETPDFEPQSRNEQYLMAMLGLYELENLPAPMSRVEKLLYKIAMGETDLSDIPAYLSRYEELLGYLAENGVGGDFEYVLQVLNQRLNTLYSTKEKPIKSAILKGDTKYKIGEYTQEIMPSFVKFESGYYLSSVSGELMEGGQNHKYSEDYFNIPTGTTSLVFKGNNTHKKICCYDSSKVYISGIGHTTNTTDDLKLNIPSNAKYFRFSINTIATNSDETYVTTQDGILLASSKYDILCELTSVKMPVLTTTGKNIFSGELINGYINSSGNWSGSPNNIVCKDFISVAPNDKVAISLYDESLTRVKLSTYVRFYDINFNAIGSNIYFATSSDVIVTAPTNAKYLKFYYTGTIKLNVQIEQNLIITTYEPYKSNILSCLEPVELGSVGEVKDELNLLTQQLTQRTETRPYQEGDELNSEFVTDMTNTRYKLAQEVVKTVDLTTLDQDGQPTKLKTFNDISYVEINSDSIIPSIDMEVAIKISETLASLDPQQNDISNTQNELGQTINEQSENTDVTMMATTEIYEQTL